MTKSVLPDTTCSWLAGLIDGEGSIMLNKRTFSGNTVATSGRGRRLQYRPVITIANTDYRLMEALAEKTGIARIYEHRVGTEKASYRPMKRRQWTWRLAVEDMRIVLPQVRPWLVLKAEQADLMTEVLAIKELLTARKGEKAVPIDERDRLVGRMDEIYAAIRALNTRGRLTLTEFEAELEKANG